MKLMVIDDEEPARQLLRLFLKDIPDVEVVGEAEDGFQAYQMIRELNPDVITLDIQMPRLTGFELLELLEKPPVILFATAYDQFALQAFEKNAADYLLKPYSRERLFQALQKARDRLSLKSAQQQPELAVSKAIQEKSGILERIAVKVRHKVVVVSVDAIERIEAEGDYVTLHTAEGRYLKEFTMKYLETHLPDAFIRVHRSNFVRIEAVQGLEHSSGDVWLVRMRNGDTVRCSAEGIKLLKRRLGL